MMRHPFLVDYDQQLINVQRSTGKMRGMGRLPALDPNDKKFMLRHPPELALIPEFPWRFWFTKEVLDQKETPQCVGYSTEAYLAASPVINPYYKTPADLYHLAQANDEWDGTDYEGTSVRGAFKALSKLGVIGRYEWATDYETVAHQILAVGPVVFGTNWYDSMFDPVKHEDGRYWIEIKDGAALAGGHAYLGPAVHDTIRCPDKSIGAVRIQNSWGRDGFGQAGRAWMSSKVLNRLLGEYGEAVIATELKHTGTYEESEADKPLEQTPPLPVAA